MVYTKYIHFVNRLFKYYIKEWLDQEGFYKNIAKNIKGVTIDEGFKKDYLIIDQVKNILQNKLSY